MTYKYYINREGNTYMEVRSEKNNIMMCLDPNEHEHKQIIDAIGDDEIKATKYANYLATGGCEYFDLTEILLIIQ